MNSYKITFRATSQSHAFVKISIRFVFLSRSSCDFLVKTFCYALLKSSFDQLLIVLFVFWFLMIRKKNKTIKIVVFQCWNVKNSFCMNASTRCANFFYCFDVFDLSLLLYVIENLKRLTIVLENVNKIE